MKNLLSDLNKEQQEAVTHTDGPLIIFAGAGSGKTRILTRRAAYLISKGIDPSSILAITFTNKAADEMKRRIKELVGDIADKMWISTFHSMCVRILRKYAGLIGYDNQFTIYDTDDSKSLIKNIIKDFNCSKEMSEKTTQCMISSFKNAGISADDYASDPDCDKKVAECYTEYEERMFMSNSMDFDDLLIKTKELFDENRDILYKYQDKFKYVMVDEYQDTNRIQFELVKYLSGGYENICVVGDDDQSIYKFRGADITNILNFQSHYTSSDKIMLEQNYRSTKNILNTANSVISNNKNRVEKKLWTDQESGEKVTYISFEDAHAEASGVISDIKKSKYHYSDIAILYRSNMQSRLLEEACLDHSVPYQIIGGINFYQRKEIKDMIAYLKVIVNSADEVAIKRIINIPKRNIGTTTIHKIEEYAKENKLTFYGALLNSNKISTISAKTKKAINQFVQFLLESREKMYEAGILSADKDFPTSYTISSYLNEIINGLGYKEELTRMYDEDEARTKIENVTEFVDKVISLEKCTTPLKLSNFLENIALISDVKETDEDKITMMTLHSSKGLEFKKVYIVGMNNGLFPSQRSFIAGTEELEEERRLCYVGITRAMESLTLTSAKYRMQNGKYTSLSTSCFINEMPKNTLTKKRYY